MIQERKLVYTHRNSIVLAIILLLYPLSGYSSHLSSKSGYQVEKIDNKLILSFPAEATGKVKVQILSDRNQSISHYNQVSKDHPDYQQQVEALKDETWNIVYPVVDLITTATMEGLMVFSSDLDTDYSINGMFFPEKHHFTGDSLRVKPGQLFQWENSFTFDSINGSVLSFSLVDNIQIPTGGFTRTYNLLSDDWNGEVRIYQENDLAETFTITNQENSASAINLEKYKGKGLSRQRLLTSLRASVEYTVRSQNHSVSDPLKDGLYLFYDLAARTYRRPSWIWGWGPSVKMLLEANKIAEISTHYPANQLLNIASDLGDIAVEYQNRQPDHPAYGILTSRWSETRNTPVRIYDFEQYYSVADALFFAGWGLVPLYRETGDHRFLKSVNDLVAATAELVNKFEVIPMDYQQRVKLWKNYAIDEQGFAIEGFNEAYKVNPDPFYQQVANDYLAMLLEKFENENGLWNRVWVIDRQELKPPTFNTRGQGWAMEGLTSMYELTGEQQYLAKAEKMAQWLIDYQLTSGSWSVDFAEKNEEEISEKGTALWSLLFYRLYNYTREEKYLHAARNALEWCLENQYAGPDQHAFGGIVGKTSTSGVIYRKWFPMTCSYTTAFFGLAVLEELQLMDKLASRN